MTPYRQAAILTIFVSIALADVPKRTSPKAEPVAHSQQAEAEREYRRGVRYAEGKNYSEAAKCYRAAAEKGLASAQYDLGYLYEQGRGVAQDFEQAAAWYRKAAVQGDPEAQNNLGVLYATGQGVRHDDTEAVRWYRLAAARNDPEATSNLAMMYLQGRGVKQDLARAFELNRKAADEGYAVAQNNLGIMYANGQGVARDRVRAYAWFDIASDQLSAASGLRDQIAKDLKPEEIERAHELAGRKRSELTAKGVRAK